MTQLMKKGSEEPFFTSSISRRDNINNLLGQFATVEQSHYRLWLASRSVLDRALHNASVAHREFEVERTVPVGRALPFKS